MLSGIIGKDWSNNYTTRKCVHKKDIVKSIQSLLRSEFKTIISYNYNSIWGLLVYKIADILVQ